MEMPDERDISKQQLWSRIDTVLETIGTVGRNTMDNLNAALPNIQRSNEMAFAEFTGMLNKALLDLKDYIDLKMKAVEKLNNDGYTKLVIENTKIKKDLDQRLQTMRTNLEDSASKKLQDSYQQLSETFKTYSDSVDEYKKASTQQVSFLQKEMGAKLGEVKALFDDMKKKFKKITEQLQ